MTRRHLRPFGTRRRQRPVCVVPEPELTGEPPDYTIEELALIYPDVIFRTAAAAASDPDVRFYDAAIVWRLPCGAFVWTPADDSRVMSVAGMIPLSRLWFAEAYDRFDRYFGAGEIGPQEVLWRDSGDAEWERAD